MKIAVLIALLGMAGNAQSCIAPPASIRRSPASLFAEADSVALVEAVKGSGGECVLHVIRSWKSVPQNPLPIACKAPNAKDWSTDFAGHTNPEFWRVQMGRLGVSASCTVLPPAFVVGKLYVVLLGVAPDTKQYEQVSGATDKWLQLVEQSLATVERVPPNKSLEPPRVGGPPLAAQLQR
jgi:hypothetical protein